MNDKKMLIDYPNLVKEWDFAKNNGLKIEEISHGSNKKVWWKCNLGHSWQAIVANRTLRDGQCSDCSAFEQRKRLSSYPDLVKEFNNEYNDLTPDEIRESDRVLRVWDCKKGHMWKASAKDRIRNNKQCSVCEDPENYLISYEHLMKEWDYEKNNITPDFLTRGNSRTKFSWKCSICSHKWKANISNRIKSNTGCPECHKRTHKAKQRKKSMLKYGSIADSFLIDEWNYKKNTDDPKNVSVKSVEQYWWICENKHEWPSMPNLRFNRKTECPQCSSHRAAAQVALDRIDSGKTLSLYDVMDNELKAELFDENHDPKKLTPFSHIKLQWKCKKKGHIWNAVPGNRLNGGSCPDCWSASYVSRGEQEVADFITSIYNGEIITSSKKFIYPYELDIYLPDMNMAFEFNGIYWHREDMLSQRLSDPKNYHFNKWKKCADKGIQLITIWEDEWRDNQDVIKKMISHKLNCSQERKIGARQTLVKNIVAKDAKKFLNTYHIQGNSNGSISLGLFDKKDNSLVAVATFKKNNENELNLLRYSTSCVVQGGLGKILKYIKKEFSQFDTLITFADHEVSNGKLYEDLGFVIDSILKPDYKYIYKHTRQHKFLFRKKRFEKDPLLKFDENLTEKELAKLNGIHRVWDCGKTKYRLNLNK